MKRSADEIEGETNQNRLDEEWNPALGRIRDLRTYSYHHAPHIEGPVIVGVDEAGRGPVLGPMVYGLAYCAKSWTAELAKVGFQDSKAVTSEYRSRLLQRMVMDKKLSSSIGWTITSLSALDISADMLRGEAVVNLNEQAHQTTMAMIQRVLDAGVSICEAYIDTVGPPESYAARLTKQFPSIKFTVAKKADSLYPVVSCASICAKVTRDQILELQLENCGSGYPSDPRTVKWLCENMDSVFGWGALVRYSWSTARDMLAKKGAQVDWPEDQKPILNTFLAHRSHETAGIGTHWFARPDTIP